MSLNRDPVLVDLALQRGGSHGAFTWGVLDRLLEEPWLKIDGISGTSAGAMNAAVLASGYAKGGPEEARKALDDFWRRVSDAALLSPLKRTPLDMLLGRWTMDTSPVFISEWPQSGLWVLGLVLGVDLLFHGVAWIAYSFSLSSRPQAA